MRRGRAPLAVSTMRCAERAMAGRVASIPATTPSAVGLPIWSRITRDGDLIPSFFLIDLMRASASFSISLASCFSCSFSPVRKPSPAFFPESNIASATVLPYESASFTPDLDSEFSWAIWLLVAPASRVWSWLPGPASASCPMRSADRPCFLRYSTWLANCFASACFDFISEMRPPTVVAEVPVTLNVSRRLLDWSAANSFAFWIFAVTSAFFVARLWSFSDFFRTLLMYALETPAFWSLSTMDLIADLMADAVPVAMVFLNPAVSALSTAILVRRLAAASSCCAALRRVFAAWTPYLRSLARSKSSLACFTLACAFATVPEA